MEAEISISVKLYQENDKYIGKIIKIQAYFHV